VHWWQDNTYDVDEGEVSMDGAQLRADLQRGEKDNLIPNMLNEDDSATEKESSNEETVQLTRINTMGSDKGDEQSAG